ncbi:hypothetical protein, partial [Candidatus Dactylopiibacterium carminicum]|uniref:hypothetical protein n=1 Tax=Candidatus Dactylopiibacterium carminicum TaxID=857335 RepID=UPI001CC2C9A7
DLERLALEHPGQCVLRLRGDSARASAPRQSAEKKLRFENFMVQPFQKRTGERRTFRMPVPERR